MNEQSPLLEIRFDGSAIGPGKISVSHLLRFLANLNKALHRVGRVLADDSESLRKGRLPRRIESAVELELVSLTEGSPAAVLGFERRQAVPHFLEFDFGQTVPEVDFGQTILETTIKGLSTVQKDEMTEDLPAGYDLGVLAAWREAGKVLGQGIDKVSFTLNRQEKAIQSAFTPNGLVQIQKHIKHPQLNVQTIEGRLLMADFKEAEPRCRVHPSVGKPILCLFDETQKDEVLEKLLRYVRIVGKAKEDPMSGGIASFKIHNIESVENPKEDAIDLSLQKKVSQEFWHSPNLEELARSQDVQPMTDIRAIFGTWPGEEDDGFEAAIDELRNPYKRHHV